MKNTIIKFLKNPFLEWVLYLFRSTILELRYRNLSIGYMSKAINVEFGINNTISEKSELNNVKLGDYSYIGNNSYIKNCTIGKYCSIANNCVIGLGIHPVNLNVSTHPYFYSTLNNRYSNSLLLNVFIDEHRLIKIGNDVWIGHGAIILDGVTISDGSVIGAGALVNKDVLPYSIVAGVPAKHIKYRFNNEERQILIKFKWWEKNINWINENAFSFSNINDFIEVIKSSKNYDE